MKEKLIRNEQEAIETIKCNMPTSGYYMLRESLEIAIKALEEVVEYNKKKQEGRLIELPCKPGDTVYILHRDRIQEILVISASVNLNGFWYFNWIIKDYKSTYHGYGVHVFYDWQIGKTVFLNYQEAKEALEEIGNKK